MIERITNAILITVSIVGIAALLLLAIPAIAKHDQFQPTIIPINAGCLDKDFVVALIQEKNKDRWRTMWNAAVEAQSCKILNGLQVVVHGIVETLVWSGDDEETEMVVVKTYDSQGISVYTWAPKAMWLERYKLIEL